MFSVEQFRDLMRRVRAGDEVAAAELVHHFEPELHRVIVRRLSRLKLHRVLDVLDVCQSVLATFFSRAVAGQFQLEAPADLSRLLVTMARNRVLDEARRYRAELRDERRIETSDEECLHGIPDDGPTPSQVVSGAELMMEFRRRLSA